MLTAVNTSVNDCRLFYSSRNVDIRITLLPLCGYLTMHASRADHKVDVLTFSCYAQYLKLSRFLFALVVSRNIFYSLQVSHDRNPIVHFRVLVQVVTWPSTFHNLHHAGRVMNHPRTSPGSAQSSRRICSSPCPSLG